MSIKRVKLSTKTALIIVSILLSFMTITSYIMVQKNSELLLEDAKDRVDDIAKLFVKINSLPLSREDYYTLENNTKELLNNDDIVLAEIYDYTGYKVTRAKSKGFKLRSIRTLYSEKQIYDYKDEVIGSVKIGLSLENTFRNIEHTKIVLMVIMGGAIIITTFSIIILIRFIINKPLSRLVESVKIVSEGDLDHEVVGLANDEIGELSENFNLMTSRLKKSRKLISNIISYMPSIMIAVDKKDRVTQWNRTAEEFTSISAKDALKKDVWEILPELAILKLYSDRIYSTHIWQEINKKEIVVDGVKKYFNISIFPLLGDEDDIEGIVFRMDDITDFEAKDQQLKQAQKMETVGTLAGGLAHDFNNVLAGVLGTIDMIEYRYSKDQELSKEQIEKYINIIKNSGNRAKDMVQQLLSLSKKHELNFVAVDLNNSIRNVIKICSNSFDKSIDLKPIYLDEKAIVEADLTQIEQILLNLCVNSSHAMTIMRSDDREIGGELEIRLERFSPDRSFIYSHSKAKEIPYWRISVSDTGVGMDKDVIAKIFDPFFTTKKKGEGTGLGMAMVYNIVTQHNGFIDIYSEVGLGTKISIYLPIISDSDGVEIDSIDNNLVKGSGTILIIDDEEIIRSQAKAILNECGYDVITAEDGVEGVEQYSRYRDEIDLILLDMVMPKLSGDETHKKLKLLDSSVKVILSSGFRQDQRVAKILGDGVLGFIQKPYTMVALSKIVAKYINGYK